MKQDMKSKIAMERGGRLLPAQHLGLIGMDEEELVSLCEEMGEPPTEAGKYSRGYMPTV